MTEMPVYTFENVVTGAQSDEFFARREDACAIGETMLVRGVHMRRLVERPQAKQRPSTQGTPTLISNALPTRGQLEQIKDVDGNPLCAPAYDEIGRPVFRTDDEVREFCKRSGGAYVWTKDYDGPTTTDERIEEERCIAEEQEERNRELRMLHVGNNDPSAPPALEKKDEWEWI